VDAQDRLQPRLQVDVGGAELPRRRQRPIEQRIHRHEMTEDTAWRARELCAPRIG